ncbi:NERD domain-containing protein [Nocardioides flavescens]|uniref:NERD domain-containing protein n=1 Tax=Nocardioides flavescens TaxID=2691959 RepID=A0A6L7F4C4_9ACTN|nr:hypothetical protein [Nocardioides flavescens]
MVAFVTVGMLVIAAVLTAGVASALTGPSRWYLLGVAHVGVVCVASHLLNSAFLALDREAIWHVRGAWGEENTREELRRARRRRLIWDWVDSIGLQAGDIDHLVITREGGLVAIDSKWRSNISRADTAAMASSAQRARRRAEGLTLTVLTKERGAHRARVQPLSITPVVVVWGAAQHAVPENAVVDGVRFIPGRELVTWLRTVEGERVTKHAARDVADRLRAFRENASQSA